ncbi:zinc ribbon domain-containing protein [Mycolicibacterium sp. CBM1]
MSSPIQDAVPTMECQVCEVDVPAGNFCGLCGSHLEAEGKGPRWLRGDTFSVAPNENVLLPSIASSLFPQIPQRSRAPFRIGLVLVLIGLIGFAIVKMPSALITICALGLPVLFVLYLSESKVYRDISVNVLAAAGILGAALGVGWIMLTGEIVARAYGVPMAASLAIGHVIREGIAIPAGGVAVMLLPTVVVRLLAGTPRQALDGFVIGALSSLTFAGGATMTRLAPQFATGLLAHNRPMKGLFVEAGICGVTIPLTAAAAGGMLGLALWFRGQTGNPHEHPGRTRAILLGLAFVVVLIHVGVAGSDTLPMPQLQTLAIHAVMMVITLLLLRVSLQIALMHEAHDPIQQDEPLLCVHCQHVVPDMAFCPACGVATRASTRWSREERRASRPVRQAAAEGS